MSVGRPGRYARLISTDVTDANVGLSSDCSGGLPLIIITTICAHMLGVSPSICIVLVSCIAIPWTLGFLLSLLKHNNNLPLSHSTSHAVMHVIAAEDKSFAAIAI